MKLPIKKLKALVAERQARKPWKLRKHKKDEIRRSADRIPLAQRVREFQYALSKELEPIIRKLSPGSPPIRLIQMLDMDVTDLDLGEEMRNVLDLLRNSDMWKTLVGPAMSFYLALQKIDLAVTFSKVIDQKTPEQKQMEVFSGEILPLHCRVFLCVSLPKGIGQPVSLKRKSTKKRKAAKPRK